MWLCRVLYLESTVCRCVGLCSLPAGCVAWRVPALEPQAAERRPVLVSSRRARPNEPPDVSTPGPCPQGESAICYASPQRPSKAGRCVWPMRPWSPCFFPGSWCTWVECALRVQSLHFPSSVECLQSSPAGFQRQMLWGLFFLLPDPPGCAAWHGALNSDSCRRTSAIYYSPVYGPLPGCQGCDYIVSAHLLSSRCGFFFMSLDVDYLFLLLLDSSLFNRWFFSS